MLGVSQPRTGDQRSRPGRPARRLRVEDRDRPLRGAGVEGDGEGVRAGRGRDDGAGGVQDPRDDDVQALAHPRRSDQQGGVLDRAPQVPPAGPPDPVPHLRGFRLRGGREGGADDAGSREERFGAGGAGRLGRAGEAGQGAHGAHVRGTVPPAAGREVLAEAPRPVTEAGEGEEDDDGRGPVGDRSGQGVGVRPRRAGVGERAEGAQGGEGSAVGHRRGR